MSVPRIGPVAAILPLVGGDDEEATRLDRTGGPGLPQAVLRLFRQSGGARLPWVVQVPTEPILTLGAADSWPRERAVFCFELDRIPEGSTLAEEIPLVSCRRHDNLIDVIADRPQRRRSQIHLLDDGSRKAWWNTAATSRGLRPGLRVPTRKPFGDQAVEILVDTRERYPYRFDKREATTTRTKLDVGDYAVLVANGRAVIERKTLDDFLQCAVTSSLALAMADLAVLPRAAVVVEARYSSVMASAYVTPGFVPDVIARLSIRYPAVPIFFADSRPTAEDWTYRWLAAARAELGSSVQ